MKKIKALLSIILFILIIPVFAEATTYTVCPSGCDYATLALAAAGVPTNAAHTISVSAGTYTESRVTDSRSGAGVGTERYWLANGAVNITNGFNITGNYVKFDGFNVVRTGTFDYWSGAVTVAGNHNIVTNCTLHDSQFPGIVTTGTYATISANTIYTTAWVGMRVDGSNQTVINNEIYDVRNKVDGQGTGDANGISFFGNGHIFRGNYIHDILFANQTCTSPNCPHIDAFQTNGGSGNIPATNALIEKNRIFHGVAATNTLLEPISGSEIYYGFTIEGDSTHTCSNITFKNNLVQSWGGLETGGSGYISNMKIYNNTFVSRSTFTNRYWGWGTSLNTGSGHEIKNNIYDNFCYGTRHANMIGVSGGASVTHSNNLFYCADGLDFTFDGYTPGASEIQSQDPLFVVDYTDLHLQVGSPCIDTGTDLSSVGVADDFAGTSRPQNSLYDIGAYETTGSVPTITDVTSELANGSYGVGQAVDIDVTFSEAVTSTGNVTVTLETGATDRSCTFTVAAATTGTCNYTVVAGDESADLTVKTISGTIKNAGGVAMTNFSPATNLAANKALVIDGVAPTIQGPSPTGAQGCTSDPRTVTVGITTTEAAKCRVSTTNQDYATMGAGKNMTTTGGVSHSHDLTLLACNASYTYYYACVDALANACTTVPYSFSIGVGSVPGVSLGLGGGSSTITLVP